jgi:hypothetical protein
MSGEHVHNFSNRSISPPTLHGEDDSTIVKTNGLPITNDI